MGIPNGGPGSLALALRGPFAAGPPVAGGGRASRPWAGPPSSR